MLAFEECGLLLVREIMRLPVHFEQGNMQLPVLYVIYYHFLRVSVIVSGSAVSAVMSNMHYACMFNRVHVSVSVLLIYLSARLNVYESW